MKNEHLPYTSDQCLTEHFCYCDLDSYLYLQKPREGRMLRVQKTLKKLIWLMGSNSDSLL